MAEENKYLKLARMARADRNSEDAKKYYDMVRTEDPENVEAKFFYSFYRLMEGTKGEAYGVFIDLCNSTKSTMSLLSVSEMSDDEKKAFVKDVFENLEDAYDVTVLADRSVNSGGHYRDLGNILEQTADAILNWLEKTYGKDDVDVIVMNYTFLKNRLTYGFDNIANAPNGYKLGDEIEEQYSSIPEVMEIAVQCWRYGAELERKYHVYVSDKKAAERYAEKIKKYKPDYVLPEKPVCFKSVGVH